MNDFDLESTLKSVPVPQRTGEYWDDFPSRVRQNLRRGSTALTPRRAWPVRLIQAGDFAFATAIILLCLQCHPLHSLSWAIASREHHVHPQFAQLNARLQGLLLETNGMGYLLSDAN